MSKRAAASATSNSNNSHAAKDDSSKSTEAIRLLMSAALETWCHQLLYVRRVYPSESFADSYFLGVRVKANRHPAVVAYISKAVKVAVPALIGSSMGTGNSNNRVADEFSLEVVAEGEHCSDSIDAVEDRGNFTARNNTSEEATSKRPQKDVAQTLVFSSCSSPSASQESNSKLAHNTRKSPNQSQTTRKAASQQSASSLSTAVAQQQLQQSAHRSHSQDSKGISSVEGEATTMEGGDSQDTETSGATQQQQQQSPLENNSLQVLEKFSLFFSSPLERNNDTDRDSSSDIEDGFGNNTSNKRRRGADAATRARPVHRHPQDDNTAQRVSELECAFRNLILNLSSLKRDRVTPSESLSFKLVLHMTVNDRQNVCPDIEKAFEAGSWYPCTTETESMARERRPRLPLYQVNVDDCNIRFHMQRKKN